MVFLSTDIFFLGLIGFILIYISCTLFTNKQARGFFFSFIERPLAISATIVMLFFLSIAVLDSIHFKKASAVTSLLDKIMAPIGQIDEKTYSSPFALTLFNMETKVENNTVVQFYPRLKYPPKNIARKHMVYAAFKKASLLSVGICLMLGLGFCILVRRIHLKPGELSALLSFFFCLFILCLSFELSRSFHILGTGKIGQDIFYFTLKSIRTGLIIGTVTTLFMLPLALLLGIMAGYFGGLIDDIIQFIYITLSSIPGVLLITASVLSLQTYISNHPDQFPTLESNNEARLLALCLILGVTSWTSLCRILRAEVLKLRTMDFIMAAKALGSSTWIIILKHLLPNVLPVVLITVVLDFSFLVLAEAVLSYVGVGVSPMTISWGNMINGARLELARDPVVWWPMAAAFLGMFTLVLSSNIVADALRDISDPKTARLRIM